MDEIKYVVFHLEDQKYGMSLEHINGIEQGYSIIPVPNAPEGIKGIINLRGSVIPVYSLRAQFGMDSAVNNPGKSLLISNSGGTMLAYEVDEVITIAEVDSEKLNKMPKMARNDDNSFLDKVLHIGKDIVIVINTDKILSEEMKEQVESMLEEEREENDG